MSQRQKSETEYAEFGEETGLRPMHAASYAISLIVGFTAQTETTVATPPSLEVTEAKIDSFNASLQEIESLLSLLREYAGNEQQTEPDPAARYDEFLRRLKTHAFLVAKLRQVVERSLEERYALEVLLQNYQGWAKFLKRDAQESIEELRKQQDVVKASREVGEDKLKVLWFLLAESIGKEASSNGVSKEQMEALQRREKRAREKAAGYDLSDKWTIYRDQYGELSRPKIEEEIRKVHQQTERDAFEADFFAVSVEQPFREQLETLDHVQRDAVRRAEAAIKETRSLETCADRLSVMARYLDWLLERTDVGNIHLIRSRTQSLLKVGADNKVREQIERLSGPRTKSIDVDPLQALDDPVEQVEDKLKSTPPPADAAAKP